MLVSSPYGEGWLAIGDAAMFCDPLSSEGVAFALETGTAAVQAIADVMDGRGGGAVNYREYLNYRWNAYEANYRHIYSSERRWGEAAFRRRRHSIHNALS